jgi:hypothetical protein
MRLFYRQWPSQASTTAGGSAHTEEMRVPQNGGADQLLIPISGA